MDEVTMDLTFYKEGKDVRLGEVKHIMKEIADVAIKHKDTVSVRIDTRGQEAPKRASWIRRRLRLY